MSPTGDFLIAQKVTKDAHRHRWFLCTSFSRSDESAGKDSSAQQTCTVSASSFAAALAPSFRFPLLCSCASEGAVWRLAALPSASAHQRGWVAKPKPKPSGAGPGWKDGATARVCLRVHPAKSPVERVLAGKAAQWSDLAFPLAGKRGIRSLCRRKQMIWNLCRRSARRTLRGENPENLFSCLRPAARGDIIIQSTVAETRL